MARTQTQAPPAPAPAPAPRASLIEAHSLDRVTAYALAVSSGHEPAGPHVRDACARHLRDLDDAEARGFYFDPEAAERAFSFFRNVLRLNGGEHENQPFELLEWQAFIVGSLMGWKRLPADPTAPRSPADPRRFKLAYIETGKGSGKSPLAAGIGLYMMLADGEPRAEIYAAATKKDQAMILFRDAVAMRDLSPSLQKALEKSGRGAQAWNLAHFASSSFFRAISSDDGQSGPRPHGILLDEIHEHKDSSVIEMLLAGTKGRRQPLAVMITNSGTHKHGVCWDYHQYGANVCRGTQPDDTFFAYICALDEHDDPFADEACWAKANPSLGHTIQPHYLRERVTQAQGMPSKEAIVRRLNFCQWVGAASSWISRDVWESALAAPPLAPHELYGRRAVAGLDLSSTTDLTAFVLLFPPTDDDPHYRIQPHFWLPAEGIADKAKRDAVPYAEWADAGYLRLTPGRAISKLHVATQIASICEEYAVESIAYDRWRIADFQQLLEDEGLSMPTMTEFGQGFKDMSPALDAFEAELLNGKLLHDGHPILTWNAANAVTVQDPAGNRKLDKQKATGRIDGLVATVMAFGALAKQDEGGVSSSALDEFLSAPVSLRAR